MKKTVIGLMLVVIVAFLAFLFLSSAVESLFGKTAQIVCEIGVAGILVILLYLNHRSGGNENEDEDRK